MSDSILITQSNVKFQYKCNGKGNHIDSNIAANISKRSGFSYFLSIIDRSSNSEVLLQADIKSILNPRFNEEKLYFKFIVMFNNMCYNIKLIFFQLNELQIFVNYYVKCLFESSNQKQVGASDILELDRYVSYLRENKKDYSDNQEDEFGRDIQEENNKKIDEGRNRLLRYNNQTSDVFVTRQYSDHSDLGLFRPDSRCSYRMSIPNIQDEDGQSILADDMLINKQKNSLYF